MTIQIHDLFYPMLAMLFWTFLAMLRNMYVRIRAVRKGQLTNEYFELFRGPEPPEEVVKAGNHFRNLMEIPPLFYIVALAVMLTGKTDIIFLVMAWSFVVFRVGQGMVHLTFNKVPHASYSFSSAILFCLPCGSDWQSYFKRTACKL